MLSTRGAITTNVAMFECARGQNTSNNEVFLLSELEKTWASVSVILRRLLVEGQDVRIANFGSFWTENRVCMVDPIYHKRYYVRRLCFGMNAKYMNQYGIDTYQVPLEKSGRGLARVQVAEVVRLCGVPARTASRALREFFLYVGEGLHGGRVFSLYFPGVATVVVKRERLMLTPDAELRGALFERDARRWPPERRIAGRALLDEPGRGRPPSSASSSRPRTRAAGDSAEDRPVFVAAAPAGRLFSEIAKDAARRRRAGERPASRPPAGPDADAAGSSAEVEERLRRAETETYGRTATPRESVYDLVENPPSSAEEPEIEEVEEVQVDHAPATAVNDRFLALKNAELEALLSKEEPFSRPISRRTFHDPSSARDLIYGGSKTAEPRLNKPEVHYGRKRFDNPFHDIDRVGALLKGVN